MRLKNKVIIISGGAGGIGKRVALFLSQEGAHLVIADKNKVEINKIVKSLPNKALGIKTDITKIQQIKETIKETLHEFKKIDVLINAAGIQSPIGLFNENNAKDWKTNIEVNLLGTISFCKEVLPVMIKSGKGKIINFSGGGATSPRTHFSAYAVSKTGIVRFTEILAKEVNKYNVQVNAVAPGAVNTKMLKEVLEAGKKAGDRELKEALKRNTLGGTSPDLVARLIVFLSSSRSGSLTGKIISAKWDNWEKWNKENINKINNEDIYVLRRIDNKYFKSIKK